MFCFQKIFEDLNSLLLSRNAKAAIDTCYSVDLCTEFDQNLKVIVRLALETHL